MAILEISNLTKMYDGAATAALMGITFSVAPGEFVSVIGTSGAGKSTLLRCINRMVESTSGDIVFDGMEINSLDRKELRRVRTKIGMIFQHYNLVNRLSVVENVLHGRLGYKSTFDGVVGRYTEQEKHQAFAILTKLGLQDHAYKRCDQLSGGQKQRVGIARALIQDPRLILCDEPIASLDPSSAKTIMDHLRSINLEWGITCILNLHQVDVAVRYSDRIIGINKGKILFDGTPDELTPELIHQIYGTKQGDLLID